MCYLDEVVYVSSVVCVDGLCLYPVLLCVLIRCVCLLWFWMCVLGIAFVHCALVFDRLVLSCAVVYIGGYFSA